MAEIVNHSRSIALERSVKFLLVPLNRFYAATTLALSSAVVFTRQLFSPREGFLSHQYNISENKNQTSTEIKKKNKKKTTRTRQQEITGLLKQKKTISWTPVEAFLQREYIASENESDGLKIIPKYFYSLTSSTDWLSYTTEKFFSVLPDLLKIKSLWF